MALFNVSVLATLSLPEWLRRAFPKFGSDLARLADASERQAATLEAILLKINEPDAVPPALHDAIEETAASAEQVQQAQEQQGV